MYEENCKTKQLLSQHSAVLAPGSSCRSDGWSKKASHLRALNVEGYLAGPSQIKTKEQKSFKHAGYETFLAINCTGQRLGGWEEMKEN